MARLTARFTEAVDYARIAHATQARKGTTIPYVYHLLGVASLVLEFGGDEDQAIAGLLHDVIEDCGAEHEAELRSRFGEGVTTIVLACTDGSAQSKQRATDADARRRDWLQRKLNYIAHLADATATVLLVSCCDKLHNARAIVQDLEDPRVGNAVFERFSGGRRDTLGYYESLARLFSARAVPAAAVLGRVVERMHGLAENAERRPLVAAPR